MVFVTWLFVTQFLAKIRFKKQNLEYFLDESKKLPNEVEINEQNSTHDYKTCINVVKNFENENKLVFLLTLTPTKAIEPKIFIDYFLKSFNKQISLHEFSDPSYSFAFEKKTDFDDFKSKHGIFDLFFN